MKVSGVDGGVHKVNGRPYYHADSLAQLERWIRSCLAEGIPIRLYHRGPYVGYSVLLPDRHVDGIEVRVRSKARAEELATTLAVEAALS
jgi:hypothetical protein